MALTEGAVPVSRERRSARCVFTSQHGTLQVVHDTMTSFRLALRSNLADSDPSALADEEQFFRQCDPERENLCLYGEASSLCSLCSLCTHSVALAFGPDGVHPCCRGVERELDSRSARGGSAARASRALPGDQLCKAGALLTLCQLSCC